MNPNQIAISSSDRFSLTIPVMLCYDLLLLCVAYTPSFGSPRPNEGDPFTHPRKIFDPTFTFPTVTTTEWDPYATTTVDQEYMDYVMQATRMGAWKLNSMWEIWRSTTHIYELDPNFTTDLNYVSL